MPFRNLLFPALTACFLALIAIASIQYISKGSEEPAPVGVLQTASPSLSTTTPVSTTAPIAAGPTDAEIESKRLTAAGGQLLGSVVNIICVPNKASPLRGISGSGVIIDSRGLILTAAHVAQYYLLLDYPKRGSAACVIRTGSPASNAYLAEPVYISSSWIEKNADTLFEDAPRGTGEDDFAVLAITGSADGSDLPASFPSVPLGSATPKVGERVAIGAYAAQFLASDQIQHELYPTIVFNSITDRFTFDSGTVDLIAVGGTPAAQEGSSGGGVADSSGNLIGLITTSSIKGDASERTLRAITPRHMRASFAADEGANFDTYLAGNSISELIANFKGKESGLADTLIEALHAQD